VDFDQIQIIMTAVMAFSTLAYAVLTVILVRETRRLREVQAEPEVVLYLESSRFVPSAFDIVASNIGATPAYELEWQYDKDHPLASKESVNLNRMKFFEGAPFFAPGQEYRSFFGMGPDLLSEPIVESLAISAQYENRQGRKFERTFEISVSQFHGRSWIGGHPDREIADALKKIQRDFRHTTTGFKKLYVDMYDSADREKRRQELEKRFESQRQDADEQNE
jgi:hypothetical protein